MKAQWEIVLDHMKKYGSIDSEEAVRLYGIPRLYKRIIYLKSQGYNFTEELRTKVNRWGDEYKCRAYLLSNNENGSTTK